MKIIKYSIFLHICLLGYLFIGLFAEKAFASEFNVGIYPPLTTINADSPSTVLTNFSLQNYNKNESIELNLEIRPFTPSSSFDGQVELVPSTTNLSPRYENFLKKIKIIDGNEAISKIILSPTQRKQLMLSVDLPKGEFNGDYYFSVVAYSKPTSLDSTNVSSIVGAIGTNFILSVGQKEKPKAVLQDFSSPIFLFNGPVPISVLLENTSQNAFSPKGNVVIRNMYGQAIGTLDLLPVNILSHSSRFIPDANSNSKTQAVWKEKALFGLYKVDLTLALSNEGPIIKRTIYFFAAPIKIMILFIITLILITIITSRIIERIKRENSFD